jgi:two-component system, chemotaxis family, protein-glutamate methylesterase/glutaminase
MNATNILIADNAVFGRRALKECLEQEPGYAVVAMAQNSKETLEKLAFKPDIVVLDSELPDADVLTTVREIRKRDQHLPIVVYIPASRRTAELMASVAAYAPVEFVVRAGETRKQADAERELISRIRLFQTKVRASVIPKRNTAPNARKHVKPQVVVIASSTGGPAALTQLLPLLPRKLAAPVVVVQHMPTSLFTESLAKSLSLNCELRVQHVSEGGTLGAGCIWIAAGGSHLTMNQGALGVTFHLTQGAMVHGVRPAADVLFISAAEIYGNGVLAVVLTGMGRDGLNGAGAIVRAGGNVIVQDEASSVVWGMPGCIVEAGLATAVLPLQRIATEITARVGLSAPNAVAR